MLSFSQFLKEDKNVHMEHAEDSILNMGVNGTRMVINYFLALRNMLAGDTKAPVSVTVKWDGAPAVFAGKDPRDGKFFVAKKGIFAKSPKVYKTDADIDADTQGDLNVKLKLALKYLPELGIEGVVQGDFLYSSEDIKKVDIGGTTYITFHPNTLVYAVPAESELAKKILASRIGVVWHTTYRGSDFETMSASFGKEIASGLKTSKNVWSIDAMYHDVSGKATMTRAETKEITAILSQVGKLFNQIDASTFNGISDNADRLMRVKAFINTKVRAGERIGNPKKFVDDLLKYLNDAFQKDIDKLKTEKGKTGAQAKKDAAMSYFASTSKDQLVKMFTLYDLLVDAKHIFIKKLDAAKDIDVFIQTSKGYEVTGREGFVAIDHMGKNAIKIVDRLAFSHANFSSDVIKGWQK